MQPLYTLTAVDLRRADEADSSRARTVQKLTFAAPKLVTVSESPGGGVMAVNHVLPRVEAPEPKIQSAGPDIDLFRGFGQVRNWTFAGSYTNEESGLPVPARGIVRGAIAQYEPDETDPESFQNCNYTWANVVEFSFTLDGQELFYVNRGTRELRFAGDDLMAAHRRALGA